MSKVNSTRSGCKDVFRAFLVKNAQFASELEIPCIAPETGLPESMLPFSKAIRSTDCNQWIHFYEDDAAFERIWNNPKKYLPIIRRFKGAISPDFVFDKYRRAGISALQFDSHYMTAHRKQVAD